MSANAFELQNRVSNLLRSSLARKIESLFDEISSDAETVRIDNLSLHLGNISANDFENTFSENLINRLRQIVVEKKDGIESATVNGFLVVDKKKSAFEELLYFLNNGYLAWYSSVKEIDAWEHQLLESFSQEDWSKLAKDIANSVEPDAILKRLSYQFSDAFLENILWCLLPSYNDTWRILHDDLLKAGFEKHLIWQYALKTAILANDANARGKSIENLANEIPAQNAAIDNFREMLVSDFRSNMILPKNGETKRSDGPPGKSEEALFLSNAGLIILHPFLPMYFEELGLTENNRFKSEPLKHRAVLLLQYLVTGESRTFETHLLLPKLLCNISFEDPVENKIDLTSSEIRESQQLLNAVIKHWAPLNRTSIPGLQETFLQREARLSRRENGWLLQVEQKTVDVLLNKLPWGIGTIKLPWMTDFLNVEWTY